jgi:uncharacterized membrane-anchored protein YjiN (DUF445 family)
MDVFKTWVLPPLIGAIIGYLTNWLAIKMLFRPLKPAYLWKMRLPFTPGILPRERHRLTQSIGSTVSTELLTPEVFRNRLSDETLIGKLSDSIKILRSGMMEARVADLSKSLGRLSRPVGQTPSEPQAILAGLVKNFLESEEFAFALGVSVRSLAEEVAKLRMDNFLDKERFAALIKRFLDTYGTEASAESLSSYIDSLVSDDNSAIPLFPPEALRPLAEYGARALYSHLLSPLESLLSTQEVRSRLESSAMDLVRSAVGRLGTIQRLIVGVANYEKSLQETMPDTIKDFSRQLLGILREKTTEDSVVRTIVSHLLQRRIAADLSYVVDTASAQEKKLFGILSLEPLKKAAKEFFVGLEGDREGFILRATEKYEKISAKPLGEIFPGLSSSLAGALGHLGFKGKFVSAAPVGLISPIGPIGRTLECFFEALGDSAKEKSIGSLLGMDDSAYESLSRSLAKAITMAIAAQAERLVEALDINTMVTERIDALDMAEVERLILRVVKDELQWITVIGGVLGAVIGLAQSFLSLI